jgi:hypothetical protein
VFDKGVTNNTTVYALGRLERDVLAHHPDYVVIIIGGHDERTPWHIFESRIDLYMIIGRIQDAGVQPVLVDIGVEDSNDPIHSAAKRDFDPLWVTNIFADVHNPYLTGVYPEKETYTKIASRIAGIILKHAIDSSPPVVPVITIMQWTDGSPALGFWAHKGVQYEILMNNAFASGDWWSSPPLHRDRNGFVWVSVHSEEFTQMFFKVRATRTQLIKP